MPRIFSHNFKSKGARQLARLLGWPRIVHKRSQFRGNFKPWVLNWGSEVMEPHVRACKVINTPEAITEATDKLDFFALMQYCDKEELCVPWTDDQSTAQSWLESGDIVVVRLYTKGHSGSGIRIVEPGGSLPHAPLYTKYVKKQEEYRVHVFNGEVIDVQQKKRRLEVPDEDVDWRVRNHTRGFIYAREDITIPSCVRKVAVDCMSATDLHFGAVDVIWNAKQDRAWVLEINTAPGLEGQTLNIYAEAIKKFTGWRR